MLMIMIVKVIKIRINEYLIFSDKCFRRVSYLIKKKEIIFEIITCRMQNDMVSSRTYPP